MACPLVVLENAYDDNWVDSATKESKHPMELLVQVHHAMQPLYINKYLFIYLVLCTSIVSENNESGRIVVIS
jgi:hypothetical protein